MHPEEEATSDNGGERSKRFFFQLEMNVTSCGPAVSFAKRKAAKKIEIPAELDIDDPFAWGTGRNHGSCPPSPVMDHEDQADDDVVVEDLEEELRLDVDAAADGEEALIDGLEDASAHMDGEDAASAVDEEALMDVVLDSASSSSFSSSSTSSSTSSSPSRPRRGRRQQNWGCFNISKIKKHGVFVGWGGDCYRHSNADDGPKTHCKKQLTGTGDDVRCLVKHWLVLGHSVSVDDADARTPQLEINPRNLECRTKEELDDMLHFLFPTHG